MRVLLISNSGRPYLEHCRGALADFYAAGVRRVGFVSAATMADPDAYFAHACDGLAPLGVEVDHVHWRYKEADPAMAPDSETRDDRIREYHVVNGNAVVGIEEETMVHVQDGLATVLGQRRVKLFRPGAPPRWIAAGERLPL